MTIYLEPYEMVGHASFLIEELFLDGRTISNWEEELSGVNQLLMRVLEKHGEPLFSKIVVTLEELLKQADRTLTTVESSLRLEAKEFEAQTWYEYRITSFPQEMKSNTP